MVEVAFRCSGTVSFYRFGDSLTTSNSLSKSMASARFESISMTVCTTGAMTRSLHLTEAKRFGADFQTRAQFVWPSV